MNELQPVVYMMVGVPYSGKSTWVQSHKKENEILIDSDSIIEEYAQEKGISYGLAFSSYSDDAQKEMYNRARKAIGLGKTIYWDNTNMTIKSRRRKLALFPDTYRKIAVVFTAPNDEQRILRTKARPNKTIHKSIIEGMVSIYQEPSDTEGFDEIIFVNTFGD